MQGQPAVAAFGVRCRWSTRSCTGLDERRTAGRPGISRVTAELLAWWERDGRIPRLFYAQKEAVDTIIFLTEARADFLTCVTIPRDDPGEERRAAGYPGFARRCCKMATGTGKSTVAAMLVAWSILNKQADRGDARCSDTVLIVCPNVTIRRRLGELDPRIGEDICPPNIPSLNKSELRNARDRTVTIRIDTGAVHETDTGNAKSDENTWMRQILGTVGKMHWAADPQGRPIYPEGYEDLAKKLDRPLHPLGRDIRCIVSVGMLTEGLGLQRRHACGRADAVSVTTIMRGSCGGGGCAVVL